MTSSFCNAYGAENPAGQERAHGGLLDNPVVAQHMCRNRAVHRFRWVCDHGHTGPIVALCEQHWAEFNGATRFRNPDGRSQEVPWNVRRDVRACPRCASLAPSPEQQHKCQVRLVTVS